MFRGNLKRQFADAVVHKGGSGFDTVAHGESVKPVKYPAWQYIPGVQILYEPGFIRHVFRNERIVEIKESLLPGEHCISCVALASIAVNRFSLRLAPGIIPLAAKDASA